MLNKNRIEWIRVWGRTIVPWPESAGGRDYGTRWQYSILGVLDVFESAIFNDEFSDMGDFELVLPYKESTLEMFRLSSDLIENSWEKEHFEPFLEVVGIDNIWCIDKFQIVTDENGAVRIVITGTGGLGLTRNQIFAQAFETENGNNEVVYSITNQTVKGNDVQALTYDAGSVYACGSRSTVGKTVGGDDLDWTVVRLTGSSLLDNMTWYGIAYHLGTVVAVGASGAVAVLDQRLSTWQTVTVGDGYFLRGVDWGNGKWVCVGGNYTYYSEDALTWTRCGRVLPSASGEFYHVKWGNDKFVAVAGNDGVPCYSTDGVNWNNVIDTGEGGTVGFRAYGLFYGDGKFMAVGSNAKIAYSATGKMWTTLDFSISNGTLYDVGYANGTWVAVGRVYDSTISGGRALILYSTNGTTWQKATIPDTKLDLNAVVYGSNQFVALGDDGQGFTSADGISWTKLDYTGFNAPFEMGNRVLPLLDWILQEGQQGEYTRMTDTVLPDLGYEVVLDTADATSGNTVLSNDALVFAVQDNIYSTLIDYAQKYDCGFRFTFVEHATYGWIPQITIRDRKKNTNVMLTVNTGVVSEQTLEFDVSNICDYLFVKGQNKVDGSGVEIQGIYEVAQNRYGDPITADSPKPLLHYNAMRNRMYESDFKRTLTNADTDRKRLRSTLQNLGLGEYKYTNVPLISVSGKLNLTRQNAYNWPFQKKVGLGDVANIYAYGLTIPIMITGMTYAQDTSGFTIDAVYKEVDE